MPTLLSCQGEKLPLNSTGRKSEQMKPGDDEVEGDRGWRQALRGYRVGG
jgi:hypothetical protein